MLRPALFNNRTYKPMFFDDSFDQMFDNAFKNFWGNNELATFDAFKTDVIDQGDSYLLQAELPGFDPYGYGQIYTAYDWNFQTGRLVLLSGRCGEDCRGYLVQ